jgi:hypothetical protein
MKLSLVAKLFGIFRILNYVLGVLFMTKEHRMKEKLTFICSAQTGKVNLLCWIILVLTRVQNTEKRWFGDA